MNEVKPLPLIIMDEYWSYLNNNHDQIIAQIREVEGIPNMRYWVTSDRVFVFDKLVQLVAQRKDLDPGVSIEDLALDLYPLALMSPLEAVRDWRIKPHHFSEHDEGTHFRICHQKLNADLPVILSSMKGVQETYVRMLMGEIIGDGGDFVYRGQPLVNRKPLCPNQLPPRPTLIPTAEPVRSLYDFLATSQFEAGGPVNESTFLLVKELEASWHDEFARAHVPAGHFWPMAKKFHIGRLNDVGGQWEDEETQKKERRLRELYPELDMLADHVLYRWYDRYKQDCFMVYVWDAEREDRFLYYLMGKAVDQNLFGPDAEERGSFIAYFIHQGYSHKEAELLAETVRNYDLALHLLAMDLADIMRFMAEDKGRSAMEGPPVITTMDTFRHGRLLKLR